MDNLAGIKSFLNDSLLKPDDDLFNKALSNKIQKNVPISYYSALKMPDTTEDFLLPEGLSIKDKTTLLADIKYEGYVKRQEKEIEGLKKLEQAIIPSWFDYSKISGLSTEIIEKLNFVRPENLGQASRVSGVTPAALSLIKIMLKK